MECKFNKTQTNSTVEVQIGDHIIPQPNRLEKVGVAPIVEKIVESCLRWFEHMWRRPVETLVSRVDQMEANPIPRGRDETKKNHRGNDKERLRD
ncbi:hypothetical protein Lal_00028062 [Lupinus albus]|nr:hypothetical protein Lal_00028062 [Lupinus albus]